MRCSPALRLGDSKVRERQAKGSGFTLGNRRVVSTTPTFIRESDNMVHERFHKCFERVRLRRRVVGQQASAHGKVGQIHSRRDRRIVAVDKSQHKVRGNVVRCKRQKVGRCAKFMAVRLELRQERTPFLQARRRLLSGKDRVPSNLRQQGSRLGRTRIGRRIPQLLQGLLVADKLSQVRERRVVVEAHGKHGPNNRMAAQCIKEKERKINVVAHKVRVARQEPLAEPGRQIADGQPSSGEKMGKRLGKDWGKIG